VKEKKGNSFSVTQKYAFTTSGREVRREVKGRDKKPVLEE